jgi:hypothetical protein
MKIFFLLRHSGYLRNYEAVVKLLADKGHHVHLGLFKVSELYKLRQIEGLLRESANITYGIYPRRVWLWGPLAVTVRLLQTYLRFLDKRYQNAHKLRQRAASMLPAFICGLIRSMVGSNENKIWFLIKCLRTIEHAIPVDPGISQILASYSPDVFLVTPLIDLRASQLDWVKCAKSSNIKTGLCVASWDNLTNKSLIQTEVDIILVWNEFQKSEAVKLHKISSSKICVTGAQCYDRWFARQPSTAKEEFLHHIGLDPKRPFILYLCSSRFIAPDEVGFVMKWVAELRKNRNQDVNRLGVLIRPHPQNALQWVDPDVSDFENVVIYPREGANPVEENSVKDFFDSMYHCEAAVGINTSPMIEAGILEKPVFTMLTPEFTHTQEGTLHFHYLVEGGLLYISTRLEEHFDQLSTVLNGQKLHKERIRTFVENFIRPHGLANPSASIFVAALENFHQQNTLALYHKTFWACALTVLITPLALALYGMFWIAKRLKARTSKKANNEKTAR